MSADAGDQVWVFEREGMMPKLMIVYDPDDRISGLTPDMRKHLCVSEATLSVPEGLEGKDIYTIARKLAELLVEQL